MATKPVNNGGMPHPLLNPKGSEAGKGADGAAKADLIAKTAKGGVAGQSALKGGGPSNYDVRISGDAKGRAEAFQKAFDIAKNTPDVREDRISDLKQRIQNGTYQIDSGKIADGMLREAVLDRLAETEDR